LNKRIQDIHVEVTHTSGTPSPKDVEESIASTITISKVGVATQVGVRTEEVHGTAGSQLVIDDFFPVFSTIGITCDSLYVLVIAQIVDECRNKATFSSARTIGIVFRIEQVGNVIHELWHLAN
jgi:hypothetical protein